MKNIYDIVELKHLLGDAEIAVIYFSNEACNVCKTLKPKIIDLCEEEFPRVELIYIDTEKSPVIAGQYSVFSIPTIDIYVMGKEHARFSRNLVMHEFETSLRKPYEALNS